MASLRRQRVRELLKRQVGEVLRREFPVDDYGIMTVNEVDLAPDLHSATVYVGIVGTDEQQKNAVPALRRDRKRLQMLVGQAVVLKYTPQLKFVIDESISRGNRVLQIIEEIERSSPPNERPPEDY